MGIKYTDHGDELGAQTKSLYGHMEIRAKKISQGWEVYNSSEGKVVFTSPHRVDCIDHLASMFDLFRLVAKVPWRVEVEEDETVC